MLLLIGRDGKEGAFDFFGSRAQKLLPVCRGYKRQFHFPTLAATGNFEDLDIPLLLRLKASAQVFRRKIGCCSRLRRYTRRLCREGCGQLEFGALGGLLGLWLYGESRKLIPNLFRRGHEKLSLAVLNQLFKQF